MAEQIKLVSAIGATLDNAYKLHIVRIEFEYPKMKVFPNITLPQTPEFYLLFLTFHHTTQTVGKMMVTDAQLCL